MRENRLRTRWQAGGAAVNGWLHIPSSWTAEVMAHQGFDSLTVDLQHGPLDFQMAIAMFQAICTTDVTPLVRVPWNEPGIIMRVLDAGAHGVICPLVNTKEECERFVGACRYFPDGYRSLGPTRAAVHFGEDYAHHANKSIITMAMVETAESLANVDDICSVPGLDAVYVGPGDLSLTLRGTGGIDHTDDEMLAALETIRSAANRNGLVAGIHTNSAAYANRMIEMGYQFVTLLSDTRLMAVGAANVVGQVKDKQTQQAEAPATPY